MEKEKQILEANIESMLHYNEIKMYVEQFKYPKPKVNCKLFSDISVILYRHLLDQILPVLVEVNAKEAATYVRSDHCKGYDSLYKSLIQTIVETHFWKLVKENIFQINEVIIYKAANDILQYGSHISKMFYNIEDSPYSQEIHPAIMTALRLKVGKKANGLILAIEVNFSRLADRTETEFTPEEFEKKHFHDHFQDIR